MEESKALFPNWVVCDNITLRQSVNQNLREMFALLDSSWSGKTGRTLIRYILDYLKLNVYSTLLYWNVKPIVLADLIAGFCYFFLFWSRPTISHDMMTSQSVLKVIFLQSVRPIGSDPTGRTIDHDASLCLWNWLHLHALVFHSTLISLYLLLTLLIYRKVLIPH